MDNAELDKLGPALEAFLGEFAECAVAPTRRLIAVYVRGCLGPLPRKSVKPIALEAGVPPRTLQELLSLHRWDEEFARAALLRRVARQHGGAGAVAVLDELVSLKKGDKTPGVARQRPGTGGRKENCVVSVQLGLAEGHFRTILDGEIYLPEAWTADRRRMKAAGIPEATRHRPRWQLALDLLDRARAAGLKFGWVAMGPGLGTEAPLWRALSERGVRAVADVPGRLRGWLHRPREGAGQAIALEQLAAGDRLREYSRTVRAGSESWVAASVSFAPEVEGRPDAARKLVVLRHPRSAEAVYLLTNASWSVPPEAAVEAALARRRAARDFAEDRRAVGFDHFEVRTWLSLKRHSILSVASTLFLAEGRGDRPRPAAFRAII
jgi:SRSO17 transposase